MNVLYIEEMRKQERHQFHGVPLTDDSKVFFKSMA